MNFVRGSASPGVRTPSMELAVSGGVGVPWLCLGFVGRIRVAREQQFATVRSFESFERGPKKEGLRGKGMKGRGGGGLQMKIGQKREKGRGRGLRK